MSYLSADARRYIRAIVKKVHPDLFPSHDYERLINAESLKLLNVYVDQLSSGKVPRPTRLEFHVKEDVSGSSSLKKITASLSGGGCSAMTPCVRVA